MLSIPIRSWIVKISLLCMLSANFSFAKESAAKDPLSSQRLTLHYALHWKGLTGKATYTVERNGSHYTIQSIAQGSGLASILGKATMTSEGSVDQNNHLLPHFFRIDKPFGSPEQATFDWPHNIITLKDGQTVELKNETAHDPLSLLFQFYWNPPNDQLKHITVVTTKKVAAYTFKPAGTERLTLNQTPIDTEIWKRYDAEGTLHMTLWLAPNKHYLPIKMHDYDGPNEIKELVLTSIESTP